MEVETALDTAVTPSPGCDSLDDTASGEGCGLDIGFAAELEAYQGLQMDFESEFSDFLSREIPRPSNPETRVRRASNTITNASTNRRVEFNADGTINCCDINYSALCMISGRPSLCRLTSLTMSVACFNSSDNLSMLSYCTPGLTTLRLDNSRIQSLRVLGDELSHLKTLSVCSCGLEDLDGISYAPNVVTLVAADNSISDVYPITELRRIHTLDLENNEFEDYGSISFLFICPKLENLVLQGNPISYDSDYRSHIFRILPGLKNLDVIMMPRAPKTVCKKDSNPSDDFFDGSSAIPIVEVIPKELEEAIEDDGQPKEEEEKVDPLDEDLIKDLCGQKSDDEQDTATITEKNDSAAEEAETKEVLEPLPDIDDQDNDAKEDITEDPTEDLDLSLGIEEDLSKDESISISLSKDLISEEAPISEQCEAVIYEKDDTPTPSKEKVHNPIIMDKVKASPVQQPSSRLLSRRKSLDPVRFREQAKQDLFGLTDDLTATATKEMVTTEDVALTTNEACEAAGVKMAGAPNLAKFMTSTPASEKAKLRPDSSMSFSSTATTSCSQSISEADSGVDFGIKASPSTIRPYLDSLPKLDSRTGTGLKATTTGPVETPSKRTKKTDKAKLLRTNSDLAGKLTTEGDVEIEDFD